MKREFLIPFMIVSALLVLAAPAQERPGAGKKPKAAPKEAAADPFGGNDDGQARRKPAPEEKWEQLSRLIQVQIEWIEMSHESATELMFLRDPKGDSTALRKEVQELVKDEEAEIVETTICLARPGQKATTESVREHIYPTEYEPASLPNQIDLGKGDRDAEAMARLATPATPTAFETRNVGTTFEIEPTLGPDHELIDLRFAPELVFSTGEAIWQTTTDVEGNESHVQMPLFYAMRVSTALTMRDGEYRFAGLLTPPGEDGEADRSRKVMVFLKCDVVAIGEEALGR